MKTINELFLTFLQDVYYAERQILKALPKWAKASQSEQLRQALLNHREETEHQVERLQQVFDHIGKRARGQTCEAIQGLIEEGEEIIHEFDLWSATPASSPARRQWSITRWPATAHSSPGRRSAA
jgi:ferritin-like metal-binding protein YciE